MRIIPSIPLGSKGKLSDIEWEAIGFLQRGTRSDGIMVVSIQNDLRVFAARSRRGSSVGRTRGCRGSVRQYGNFAQGGLYRGR